MERRDIHREALKTPGKCNTVTVYLNAGWNCGGRHLGETNLWKWSQW
jgi:hypothetical protein